MTTEIKAYRFICLVCGEPSVLHQLYNLPTEYVFGIEICKCKGVPPEVPEKPTAKVFFLNNYRKKGVK